MIVHPRTGVVATGRPGPRCDRDGTTRRAHGGSAATAEFRAARDFLLAHREDYRAAYEGFRWPRPERVQLGARLVRRDRRGQRPHRAVDRRGGRHRVAGSPSPSCPTAPTRSPTGCARQGVAGRRPDRCVMLGNQVELWETMLAAMKLRRRRHPGDHAARPRRPARPGRARRRPARDRARRRHRPSSTTCPATTPGSRSAAPADGWLAYADAYATPTALRPGRADPGRRPAAALLHLRHDRAAQAGRAHPRLVPGRPPLDDVLDRAAARRRAPQHLLARLGQARLEQPLRAVERRGDRLHPQLHPLRRRRG